MKQRWSSTQRWARTGAMAVIAGTVLAGPAGMASGQATDDEHGYLGTVEVVRQPGAPADAARGVVFDDTNRDGRHQGDEPGVAGVSVSNGRDVVVTDADGRYELEAYDGMTVFVTEPAGWDTPLDEHNVPQFSYHHLPQGSPELRFGGLEPTGPLPTAINFPLAQSGDTPEGDDINCAVVGDTQTYSNRELGYLRDGLVADLAERDDLDECGVLIVGDVVGDDLSLFPRLKEVMSAAGVPIRTLPGNHDLDFDATDDAHSFDTYKREMGPTYYSYDVGEAHVVALDNVRYPCTPDVDGADGKHAMCDDPEGRPTYNGVIGEQQLTWLANDLANVPEDKLIVIASHIGLLSFTDMHSTQHQTDDVAALYELLEGRPAVALNGHTQVMEKLETGDSFAPWKAAVGVEAAPFPHITVGAASGSWWTGDLDTRGIPESIQRSGAPAGYVDLALVGNSFVDTYRATGKDADEQMSLSISSPFYRSWFDTLMAWKEANPGGSPDRPPVNINDLGDPNLLTRADLAGDGSALMVNVWGGATTTTVTVQIDDGAPVAASRTQEARGEDQRSGAEYSDPAAAMRQLMVTRFGFASSSGDERAQGWEAYRGSKFGPGPAQPIQSHLITDHSSHLWRLPLAADLAEGAHVATVVATDAFGRTFEDRLVFEVVEERPPLPFRTELFQ